MTFNIKKLADSQVELTVELDKQDLLKYVDKTEKRLARELKVEGFRPGKAPQEMVRKTVGEEALRQETMETAIRMSLAEVLDREKLDIIDRGDLKIKENPADKLVYQIMLTLFPEVKLGEYKGLVIKRGEISVGDEEVKKVIDDVMRSRATLAEVDRPAQTGDRVEVDFEVKDGGQTIEGGKSQNHPIILGEEKFMPGFENSIVGLKKGETKSFSLTVPKDYYQKTIAGKLLNFEVKVNKVEDRVLPRLDNEFAKSVGRFSSVSELEASIKQGLMAEKEIKERDRARLAILQRVVDESKTELPKLLVERQLDSLISGFDNELHQNGLELGLYLAHIGKTQDQLRTEWRSRAENQVKINLIARAIAQAEKLRVSEDDVETELQAVLQSYLTGRMPGVAPRPDASGPTGPEALEKVNTEDLRRQISDAMLSERVFEFLEKNTKFS